MMTTDGTRLRHSFSSVDLEGGYAFFDGVRAKPANIEAVILALG